MANNTINLKLLIQEQTEYYNIDRFNENFQKIDQHAGELASVLSDMKIDGGSFTDVSTDIVFDAGKF